MHIVLVHQYHHNPDCPASCRHYDFVEQWARRHRVTIISSAAWESQRITDDYPWVPDGAELIRVPVPYRNEMGITERAKAFFSFAARAVQTGRSLEAPDIVVGSSTPLTAAWAARNLARHWDVPFVFEVRDLWPDFPIEMGAIPKPLHALLRKAERDLYASADHVVALSPDIAAHVASCGIAKHRVTTLLHGTDVASAAAAADSVRSSGHFGTQSDDRNTILYAGAFGRANGIPEIIRAAEILESDSRFRFLLAGHGFHETTIRDASSRLKNVELAGPVPRHAIFDLFATSFLSLVTFTDVPSVAAGSPSKLFDSLATGCPVLVNANGWTRELVETHRCGWYVRPGCGKELAARISQLGKSPQSVDAARAAGMTLARAHFDRGDLAYRFENILSSLVTTTRPPGVSRLFTEAA